MPSSAFCRSCGCTVQLDVQDRSRTANSKCPKCGRSLRLSSPKLPIFEEPSTPRLTEKETRLVRLLSTGKSTKEIAQELGITTASAFVYRNRIKSKLGVSSLAELVRYAVQMNIVPVEPPTINSSTT